MRHIKSLSAPTLMCWQSQYNIGFHLPCTYILASAHARGYSNRFVCECVSACVCVSVAALAATYLFYMSKVRRHYLPAMMIGNLSLSRQRTHQWFLTQFKVA